MIGKNIVSGVSSLVTSEKERSEKEYERSSTQHTRVTQS